MIKQAIRHNTTDSRMKLSMHKMSSHTLGEQRGFPEQRSLCTDRTLLEDVARTVGVNRIPERLLVRNDNPSTKRRMALITKGQALINEIKLWQSR